MYKHEEKAFESRAEKMLASHRELPTGRDFRSFYERFRTDTTEDFRKRYDDTFPDAPGSPRWFDAKFK